MKYDKNSVILSWTDIENDCNKIAKEFIKSGMTFDVIITIQRGGCIPGIMLSHKINCSNIYTINIRTTETEEISSKRLKKPIVYIPPIIKNIKNKKVLIIDDVTNTGLTLNLVKQEILKYQPAFCATVVLVWDGDNNNNNCSADYYARYTPKWVIFPWEKEFKTPPFKY